MNGLDKNVDR